MTVETEQHGGRIRDLGAIILALTLVQMAVAGVGLFVPLLLAAQLPPPPAHQAATPF